MNKPLLIAATAIALTMPSFSSLVTATEQESKHPRFSTEDHAAFTDARIAALKAGLKLTPSQEKNWPPLEAALREAAKSRSARLSVWREKAKAIHEHNDVIEALRLHAKGLSALGGEMEKVADAAKPLFDSLDDAQKRRFGVLLHVLARSHWPHWRWKMSRGEGSDAHEVEHDD
jgi:zinc resistance-associated protein